MTMLKKHRVGIVYEFLVYCVHDYVEPDGYYYFAENEIPQPGCGMILCCGHLAKVTRVSGSSIYTKYADEEIGRGAGY